MIYALCLFGCAMVLGHRMAGHYQFDTQLGYVGWIVVVPLAVLLFGIPWSDAITGCTGCGVGFAAARNNLM